MNILSFQHEDLLIEVTHGNKKIAITFEHEGKRYGNSVNLKTKKTEEIISATFLLFCNVVETYKTIKDENK